MPYSWYTWLSLNPGGGRRNMNLYITDEIHTLCMWLITRLVNETLPACHMPPTKYVYWFSICILFINFYLWKEAQKQVCSSDHQDWLFYCIKIFSKIFNISFISFNMCILGSWLLSLLARITCKPPSHPPVFQIKIEAERKGDSFF